VESALPIAYCKRQLARIWFIGGGLVFFIVLVPSLIGRYGEEVTQAWGWALASVLPTLSLIIGQLVFDAVQGTQGARTIDRFLFRLTVALSSFYLLAVLLVILVEPFANGIDPVQLMHQSNVALGPLQGLVTAAMGAFFVKAAKEGFGPEEIAAAVAVEREKSRESDDTLIRPSRRSP
jgi:hypothetical protein